MTEKIILCLDDETPVLHALQRLFWNEDVTVLAVTCSSDALKVLRERTVLVILSDQRMSGMLGTDFLREAARLQPHTVRVILSGHADTQDVLRAIDDDAVYLYFPKPWNGEELKASVLRWMEKARLSLEKTEDCHE